MGDEAALREASSDEQVPQLGLCLPGDSQDGHVQPLVVTIGHLLLLSCLSSILPSLWRTEFTRSLLNQSEYLTVTKCT